MGLARTEMARAKVFAKSGPASKGNPARTPSVNALAASRADMPGIRAASSSCGPRNSPLAASKPYLQTKEPSGMKTGPGTRPLISGIWSWNLAMTGSTAERFRDPATEAGKLLENLLDLWEEADLAESASCLWRCWTPSTLIPSKTSPWWPSGPSQLSGQSLKWPPPAPAVASSL